MVMVLIIIFLSLVVPVYMASVPTYDYSNATIDELLEYLMYATGNQKRQIIKELDKRVTLKMCDNSC